MMLHITKLVKWEWFKLSRRWMPWIVLAITLVFSQMPIWGGFFDYRGRVTSEVRIEQSDGSAIQTGLTCDEIRAGRMPNLPEGTEAYVAQGIQDRCRVERIAETRSLFVLPDSLTFPFGIGQVAGMLGLAVLMASMLGIDYSWGTLRTVLLRGTGRWKYLTAKVLSVVLFAAAVWTVVAAATVVNSVWATALAPEPPPDVADYLAAHSAGWSDMLAVVGRAFVAILPYLSLALFVTVITASLAAGIAVSLGYYFIEAISALLLINVLDLNSIADYLLVRNITAWMLGSEDQVVSGWFLRGPFGTGQYPSELHGLLVMLAYLLSFGAFSFWLFRKRDVAGARGE